MKRLILLLLLLPGIAMAEPAPSPAIADKLQSALADVLNKSVQAAGDAKNFLVEQLPDVIKQLLAWRLAKSIGECLFAVLLGATLLRYTRWYFRFGKSKEWDFDRYCELIPASFGFGLGTLIGWFIVCVYFNIAWLQIWLAPKVYLIEYASKLITHS